MQRWIAAILAVFNVANGLVMLLASSTWWNSVPGVPDTGPFNLHFVQDVGVAFWWRAWRSRHAHGGRRSGRRRLRVPAFSPPTP